MSDNESKSLGWLESLRRSGDSILGLAQNRFELFTVELQEEKLRAINLLIWLAAAVALGIAGVLVLVAVLALVLWEIAGYLGLVGLGLISLFAAVGILWSLHCRLQTSPTPFSTTIEEFKKDRECLRRT